MARVKHKLKNDSGSSQPKRESFTKLFENHQSAPAAVEPRALSQLTSASELKANNERKIPSPHSETLAASVPSRAPERSHKSKRPARSHSLPSGWFLLVPALGLTAFVLLSSEDGRRAPTELNERPLAEYEKPEFRDRVEFHRKTTGWKLNSERIAVDLYNRLQPADMPPVALPLPKDTIMKGLPLAGERNPRDVDEPKRMVPEVYPDANVQYQISREQQAIDFDEAARQEFIRELKANAAQAGYKVEIDTEGNARFTRVKRKPSSGN